MAKKIVTDELSTPAPTAIVLSPATTEMLIKLWGKYTGLQTEANKHLEAFKEFEQYIRHDLNVPSNFIMTPDGKQFVEPAKNPVPVETK